MVGTLTVRSATESPEPESSDTVPASGSTESPRLASADVASRTTVAATAVRVGRFFPVRRIPSTLGTPPGRRNPNPGGWPGTAVWSSGHLPPHLCGRHVDDLGK